MHGAPSIGRERGDFTADVRLIFICALAIGIGAVCSVVAVALLRLIALFTNLFYFQRLSLAAASPALNTLGWAAAVVPVIGGLIVGLMARYGSEKIRGHGIPEALEAILIGRSRMQPRVAVLKPVSAALSIGTGGPFGAEGPIIVTGGAVGSIVGQAFHLTAAERKTLLVAGAAGGMTATFATPVAAVLLAVELLLFEFKPRSLIPVALASFVAALLRPYLLGHGPLFAVPLHGALPASALLWAAPVGLAAGVVSLLLTRAVYATEDAFARVPLHWMWWPAIGGMVVGVGGLIEPHALGVGYDNIDGMLKGQYVAASVLLLMAVKGVIWPIALGSGTSGGVLAPLLTIGGALGAVAAPWLPGSDRCLWPLVGMAAVLGGTMRVPLTGMVFAVELTGDLAALPALLIAVVTAYAFTVLVLKRSILTEKVARRGYHLSGEYHVDPLETVSVAEAMTQGPVNIPAAAPLRQVMTEYFFGSHKHQGFAVLDAQEKLLGVVARSGLPQAWVDALLDGRREELWSTTAPLVAADLIDGPPITAYPWESCRMAAERMAAHHVGRLVVVDPQDPRRVVGMVTRSDLFKARRQHLEQEGQRERFLGSRRAAPKAGE